MNSYALLAASILAAAAHAADYDALRIVAPGAEATLHDNLGRVTVVVEVEPALGASADERIELLLDGKLAASGTTQRFELNDLARGTHTLQARIAARDGSVLKSSPPVTFHLWQASRLFRPRKE